jgi:hypothetical protein
VQVELEADDEEQDRDAQLGEDVGAVTGSDPPERVRPDGDPHRDEGDDQRLLELHGEEPGQGGQAEDSGDLVEAVLTHGRPVPAQASSTTAGGRTTTGQGAWRLTWSATEPRSIP